MQPWAIKVIVNRGFLNKLYHDVKKKGSVLLFFWSVGCFLNITLCVADGWSFLLSIIIMSR